MIVHKSIVSRKVGWHTTGLQN